MKIIEKIIFVFKSDFFIYIDFLMVQVYRLFDDINSQTFVHYLGISDCDGFFRKVELVFSSHCLVHLSGEADCAIKSC